MSVLDAPQVRAHVPMLGRETGVQLALLPKGVRIAPVKQVLYVGGYLGTYTVTTVTSTNAYVAVVAGTAYTVTAGASDTQKSIAYKLAALINAGTTGVIAQNVRNTTGSVWVFDLYKPSATFTLATTGTTTPADVTAGAVSGNTTAIAKGATSISLVGTLLGEIQASQYLQAVDANGIEYLLQLSATAAAGGSSLSVVGLDEGIPAGSQIAFPVEFFDRTDADTNKKIDSSDFLTFNTAGNTDAVATKITQEGKLSGIFFERCPSYNTINFAVEKGREVWLSIIDPVYKDGWTRRTVEGAALILSQDKSRKTDGFITNDMSYRFLGKPQEIPAAPLY